MAGMDKTYTKSYKEYREFKDWANKQVVTFFNGHKERVGEWVAEYEEKDFDGTERAVMNSPEWLDAYLIQNCKVKFVLDRMKEVRGESSFNELKKVDLSARPPEEFQQNRKIVIKRNSRTNLPLQSKPRQSKWWLIQSEKDEFDYCDESKFWSNGDFLYPYYTNTSEAKSVKAVVRHLRKQYLPKGAEFVLIGSIEGEVYSIMIS